MDGKPIHYDGSTQIGGNFKNELKTTEPFKLTDEMRANISGNPYEIDIKA
ncbi:hypothetical protein [Pseudalkalibacillus caeni]|nr:hypothetical protein [Pseudalkalibacillus caeni]